MKIKMLITVLLVVIVLVACSPVTTSIPTKSDITTSIPLDSNSDGKFTPQELEATFAQMRKEVKVIAESQPSVAARFEADIASFENALRNDPMDLDIGKIIKTVSELVDVVQTAKELAAKELAAKNQKNVVYLSIAMAAVILFLVAFLLVRRRRSKRRT